MYDEKHQVTNKPLKDRCRVGFKRAILRVFSEESTNTTMIEVKPEGQDQWISCISTGVGSLNFNVHTYIASGGTEPRRKAHFIHSVKFYDNEEEMEAEKEQKEMNELYGEKEKKATGEKAVDLLHMGNYDGALL